MVKIEQNFLGIWELEEWVVEKPNGKKTFPFSGKVNVLDVSLRGLDVCNTDARKSKGCNKR